MISLFLNNSMAYSERLELASRVTVIGLLTVFSVLAILMLSLLVFQFFSYTLPQKKKKKKENSAVTVPTEETAEEVDVSEDNGELVAAITAAVICYRSEEPETEHLPFRVVSLKRKKTGVSWNGNTGVE